MENKKESIIMQKGKKPKAMLILPFLQGLLLLEKYLGDREGGIIPVTKEWEMGSSINLD